VAYGKKAVKSSHVLSLNYAQFLTAKKLNKKSDKKYRKNGLSIFFPID
jgi:hypothetical protein